MGTAATLPLLLAMFSLAACILSSVCTLAAPPCSAVEREALLDLQASVLGTQAWASSWSRAENTTCCGWEGIECAGRNIISIRLPLAQVSAYHPPYCASLPASLGNLTSLQTLDFRGGCFTGSIPLELASLVNLTYLDLSNNQLHTAFPLLLPNSASCAGFPNLRYLNLSLGNYLEGDFLSQLVSLHHLEYLDLSSSVLQSSSIPENLGSSMPHLQFLNLHNSDLQGVIPPGLSSLQELLFLDLSENEGLQGEVPVELGSLRSIQHLALNIGFDRNSTLSWPSSQPDQRCNWSAMKFLQLGNVKLPPTSLPFCFESLSANLTVLDLSKTGMLDSLAYKILARASNLTFLSLAMNSLAQFPPWLPQLRLLETLDISYNPLQSGIPPWIIELEELRALFASNATIAGRMPVFLSNMSRMYALDLSRNALSGPLPDEWIGGLKLCDLSWNEFEGSMPNTANWSGIRYIDISHNRLKGALSQSVGNMTHVQHLDLSANQFIGCIPDSVGQLSHLGEEIDNLVQYTHFQQLNPGLNLSYNMLGCSVPESLGKLGYLRALSLSKNHLSGSLPQSLANMTKLRLLDVSGNEISGDIPPNMPDQLVRVDASQNMLSGSLYSFLNPLLIQSLQFLDISHNKFQGGILPAQSTFSEACSMRYLDLSQNELSGTLPGSIGNCQGLSWLKLGGNFLHGEIPSSLGDLLRKLQILSLYRNLLVGKIPSSLQKCTELQAIDLSFNELTGEIPDWITSLSSLRVLILGSNRLGGSIPKNLTEDKSFSLQMIDISNNQLTGRMPEKFDGLEGMKQKFNSYRTSYDALYFADVSITWKGRYLQFAYILTALVTVDFSGNLLEGQLEGGIGMLQGLVSLNLSHNMLSGPIPSSLSNLSELESLDLSHNQLEGLIPSSLSQLTKLALLNLSSNHLQGPIPEGVMFEYVESYYDNPELCGPPITPGHACAADAVKEQPRHSAIAILFSRLAEHVSLIGLALAHIVGFVITALLLKRKLFKDPLLSV